MAIIRAASYQNLMSKEGERVWAFIINEVGMKKAQEIAKRVMSDEKTPEDAKLLTSF